MTFNGLYKADPYPLEIYQMCENEIPPTSRLSKAIVSQTYIYMQTDRQPKLYTTSLAVAGGKK